ncbi:hypothetical protein CVD25_22810 [Bacillus canaveralius]|uniref:Divalent metal cation transporter n=2 Tax=Bacillus canaveralius TaxID=1403243 RepID=A0A2N5GGB2_9BACI|nr:hypothetical protein CU635_21160 [Bacillus canaveralius]PLR88303.1 hypothetical protein CVD25_22810 [Bacillus canaveralius]
MEVDIFTGAPSHNLPALKFRDMPEAVPIKKMIGPSIIIVGAALGTGEYVVWPYVTSQVGFSLLWLAFLGITVQFFMNMEIERYTLATGETAIVGFSRFWKPWGMIFIILALLQNMWPAWATSGATALTFLLGGGNVTWISIGILVICGLALSLSPVIYKTVEKAQFVKVGLVLTFLLIAIIAAISTTAWIDLPGEAVGNFGRLPGSDLLSPSLLIGAIAAAGAGGVINLVQSNWIRDKGYGIGAYIPRLPSPITGEDEAKPATGFMMRQDKENLVRWKAWWKNANIEQFVSFWVIALITIVIFSLIAYSTVYNQDVITKANLDFIKYEGEVLKDVVGNWFGNLFWLMGVVTMFFVSLAVIDLTSRIGADVLKTMYLTNNSRFTEGRIYIGFVWGIIAIGASILLLGFNQPLLLVFINTSINGVATLIASVLLIQLNRKALPKAIRVEGFRFGMMLFTVLFFSVFAFLLVFDQARTLFGG